MTGDAWPAPGEILTVSEAVARARDLLEEAFPRVLVRGEISRFLHHPSGHMYLQLKDAGAALPAAMFRAQNQALRFRPADGMEVLAVGRLSVYQARGQFQMIISELEPLGVGSLHLAFEQRKARLAAEGLFDPARKRPLPLLPRRVGVATSPSGAALRDILQVLGRRFAELQVLIAPCRVQGEGAAEEVAGAIRRLERHGVEVILVARGGGSLEDLWAFNEEAVARAIAAAGVPVITGIGHEIDTTIADLVADLRAPTPSAAAEVVVLSKVELARRLQTLARRLGGAARLSLGRARERVRRLQGHPAMARVPRRIRDAQQRLDEMRERGERAVERQAAARRRALEGLASRLAPRALLQHLRERRRGVAETARRLRSGVGAGMETRRAAVRRLADLLSSVSPLAVLARGYSICEDPRGGVVRRWDALEAGEAVGVQLHLGRLECRVERAVPPAEEEG